MKKRTVIDLHELWEKIKAALISTLPITAIVYIMALTPLFEFSRTELITFTSGAVMLVLGIGLFSLGADLAMTPMGSHVGSGLSRQRKLGLLLTLGVSAGAGVAVYFVVSYLFRLEEARMSVQLVKRILKRG